MFTLVWCGTFMIQRQVNQMSAAHISGYMYAVLVEDLLLIPIWATKDAAAYIMAQNAGAGKVTQLRKYFWRLNRLEWLFCLIVWGVIWLWGPSVIRFVVGPASEEVTSYVERWFQICMIGFPALSMDQIGGVSLQAMGAYRTMGFLGLLEGVLGIVLAVFVINGSGFDGIAGSYLCIFLSMGIAFGLSCHMVLKRMGEERINGV